MLVEQTAQAPDLVHARLDKTLPTEARVHAHKQDQVNIRENLFKGRERRTGVEHHSRAFAQLLNLLNSAVQMGTGFLMDRENVCSSAGEIAQIPFRLDNHQVDVQRKGCRLADRLNDERTDGDVGNEPAVHDVEMNPVCSRLLNLFYFLSETTKVSGKDGRHDFYSGPLHANTSLTGKLSCGRITEVSTSAGPNVSGVP